MYHIQHQTNSSMMIRIISSFHILHTNILNAQNNIEWVPGRCMFLQEKVEEAKQLHRFADQLKYKIEKQRLSKIDALQQFEYCHQDISYFNNKLHSIGYIHGDISVGNILYGTKLSIKVSLSNSTSGQTYKYELVDTYTHPRCYIIDFGGSKSKNILTINHSVDQRNKYEAKICPTFLFAHPFLLKFIAYHEGRLSWTRKLAHEMNLTKDAIDDAIWNSVILCEKYAVATSFLFALERTNIFHEVLEEITYSAQLDDLDNKLKSVYYVPTFGTQQQLTLFQTLQMIQQLNINATVHLYVKIQCVDYVYEKLVAEKMILSMKEIIYWYPIHYDFPLNRSLNVQLMNVTSDVVIYHSNFTQ